MRECGGFKMGPCELMDLIGHDVNFAVTKSVYEGFFDDPRYKPSLVQKDLVDAGWLGRKSGRGFFDYREGAAAAMPDDVGSRARCRASCASRATSARPPRSAACCCDRTRQRWSDSDGAGLLRVDGFAVALSDGRTATERSVAAGRARRAVRPRPGLRCLLARAARLGGTGKRPAPGAKRSVCSCCWARRSRSLADVPGLAVTRTVAMLVNEAADAVQQGIASADDVDAAMQKGVNYPIGPMAWGRRTGFGHVATVLRHLARSLR